MSEKTPHRRPATFKLDDANVVVMDSEETGRLARGTVRITPEADPAQLPVPIDAPLLPARRGFRWGTMFWSAAGGLVSLGLGLAITQSDRGSLCAQPNPRLLGLGLACCRGAGARGRDRPRVVRPDAAGGDRKTASARH